MPTIGIADGFGLDLEAATNPNSAFAKYFQKLPSLSVVERDLASLQNVPLTAFPLKSVEIGLSFKEPTTISSASPQLAGSVAISGSLCVIPAGKLFDPDPFASPIEIPSEHAYLALGIQASIAPGMNVPVGEVVSGFTVGTEGCITHYKSFQTTSTAPTFAAALEATLQSFVIPFGVDDLASLSVGDVVTVEGSCALRLCGTLNLLTSVNPLATLSTPALPGVAVKAGAAIDITATFTVEGNFQVRIHKVAGATLRMGFYRKRGSDFTVQVNPSVGVTAGTTKVDFISTVLGAVTPFPNADQLAQAGLTNEKQEVVVGALKTAVQRQLELAVLAQLQSLSSDESAFLYEINLQDLGPEGKAALEDALRLNLTTLLGSPGPLPRGIAELQNLFTNTRKRGHTLSINILGIYNYASIDDLLLKGTILTDAASGAIIITDEANATRVRGAVDFLADSDKLRKVLAQSFLITAAYRCSGLIAHGPTLRSSYWHFELHAKTDRRTMAGYLDALLALGLISEADKEAGLSNLSDFGSSTCYLGTDYDDTLSQSLYLRADGQAREIDEFEQTGRQALRDLLQEDGDDGFRLRSLVSDAVWQQVKATGGTATNLARLFPDLRPDSEIPIIAGDYLLIEWWADTMSKLAVTLSAARRFFAQDPPPAANSPAFKQVQDNLWRRMAEVASNTHDRFGDPWGLIAMDLASGRHSQASARIVSPHLTIQVARAPA